MVPTRNYSKYQGKLDGMPSEVIFFKDVFTQPSDFLTVHWKKLCSLNEYTGTAVFRLVDGVDTEQRLCRYNQLS